jgi:hypothetical protein
VKCRYAIDTWLTSKGPLMLQPDAVKTACHFVRQPATGSSALCAIVCMSTGNLSRTKQVHQDCYSCRPVSAIAVTVAVPRTGDGDGRCTAQALHTPDTVSSWQEPSQPIDAFPQSFLQRAHLTHHMQSRRCTHHQHAMSKAEWLQKDHRLSRQTTE